MSTLIFEVKEEHIKLLKDLKWCMNKGIVSGVADEGDTLAPPFGGVNLYESIDLILNGKPEGVNPFMEEEFPVYSEEQKAEWDKLYSELPLALDIILFNGHFDVGIYKTRYHLREWLKTR